MYILFYISDQVFLLSEICIKNIKEGYTERINIGMVFFFILRFLSGIFHGFVVNDFTSLLKRILNSCQNRANQV